MPIAPDLAGTVLDDRYELHHLIGEGTFGCVYRGLDRRLRRPVAIKVIKPWWADDPDWAERFEREAQLLARLSDPGIVQVFDVGQSTEGLYYVAELVDGESLSARLRGGPLAAAGAADIACQVCAALAHTHDSGIVHRDIKPGNILLARSGRVKLGDFSLARLAKGTSEGPPTLAGTPTYMAPEQARGRPPSAATDIYSLGVVLYEMLSGRPPFSASSPVELALHHLQDPPPPLPDHVPPGLRDVVARALAKEPGERFAAAAVMASALHGTRFAAGRPLNGTGAERPPRRPVTGPGGTLVSGRLGPRSNLNPSARRRAGVLIAAVAALVVTMFAAAAVLGRVQHVRMPALRGLPAAAASRALVALHLRPVLNRRYDGVGAGITIAQWPPPRTELAQGAHVAVVVSAGPPPVRVPALSAENAQAAGAALARLGLRSSTAQAVAPTVTPGTVTAQSPAAGRLVPAGSTVRLSVAEVPRWRTVTTFSGTDGGDSGSFRIRGAQWRIVYRMSYVGTCTFVLFCSGPAAHVREPATGADVDLRLSDGAPHTRTLAGPGSFDVQVSPGSDTANWTFEVQDLY